MSAHAARSQPSPDDFAHTSVMEWIGQDTIRMVTRGYVDVSLAQRNARKFEAMMDGAAPRWLLIDARDMTGYDLAARVSFERQFRAFRKWGGEQVLLVNTSSVVSMVASALSVVVELPMRIFATMDEALAYMGARRAS
ncbi:MAG: hypothetical protein ACOCV4_02645 [Myxococcota bacterium]